MVNSYIAIKINLWSYIQGADITLGNSLFDAVNLIKNSDPDKYSHFGYGGSLSLSAGSGFGKNVTTFGSDMSLFALSQYTLKWNSSSLFSKADSTSGYNNSNFTCIQNRWHGKSRTNSI